MVGSRVVASLLAVAPLAANAHVVRQVIGDYHEMQESALVNKRQADTSKIPRPTFGSIPWGVDIRSCNVPGKVALTFDDGPESFTPDLLDTLKAAGAKATFFVVGSQAAMYPDTVKRAYEDGHQIGSHSWSHQDLEVYADRDSEILKNEAEFLSLFGFFPTYFRPPFTSCGPYCMEALTKWGYHVTNYDVDTKDFEGDYNFAQNTFTSGIVKGGGSKIVLAHDIQEKTVHGFAEFMIENAKAAGFELVTFGECLGDPAGNWYRDANGNAVGGGASTPQSSSAAPSTSSATPTPTSTSTSSTPTPTPTSTSTSSTPTPTPTTSSVAPPTTTAPVRPTTTTPAAATTTSPVAPSTGAGVSNRASGSLLSAFVGLLALIVV